MPPPKGTWNPLEGPGDFTFTGEVHNDTYPGIDPTKANLAGKSVFITGASRGIGSSISVSFAKAGASQIAIGARGDLSKVEIAMKEAAQQAGRDEPRILLVKLDVSEQSSVEEAAKLIEKEFGKLDIVINNAGINGHGSIGESDPDEWLRIMNVNIGGPYLIARACLPLVIKSQLKTMITISSVAALLVLPSFSAYQISKLAVLRLMESLDAENKEHNLVAYSVHPGNVLTDIVNRGEGMPKEKKAIFTETPELCGDTLAYLCNEKRDWLSGRYVNCTWDMPELTSDPKKDEIIKGDKLKVRMAV